MKKILFCLLLSFITLSVTAASKAEITFSETTHDFGTIKANEGSVTATYTFTNTGDAPLIIINVTNGGCGCTTPSYPKEPIAPGMTGEIKIHFNPTGRRGEFNREVKVKSNASSKRQKLTFKGVIMP
ncbi:MAG: DUF1573 domain-containing protein [Paramuribaculum sp.]|nr:DUF1573 domain-containing protein [Paramuribaculum sp.]